MHGYLYFMHGYLYFMHGYLYFMYGYLYFMYGYLYFMHGYLYFMHGYLYFMHGYIYNLYSTVLYKNMSAVLEHFGKRSRLSVILKFLQIHQWLNSRKLNNMPWMFHLWQYLTSTLGIMANTINCYLSIPSTIKQLVMNSLWNSTRDSILRAIFIFNKT